MDGSGFPRKIKAESIPVFTRIVTMADTFDNLMNPSKQYKILPHLVLENIMAQVSSNKLCREIYQSFVESVSIVPSGTMITLTDNKNYIVIKENIVNPTRPIVREISTGETLDLLQNRNLFIDKIIC